MKFRFVLEHGSAEREHAHMSVELLEREVAALRAAVSAERAKIAQLERERSALQQQARELSVALKAAAREKKLLEAVIKDALRRRTGLDLDAPGQLRLLFGEEAEPEPTPPYADEAPDGETPEDSIRQRHRPRRVARQLSFHSLPREHVVHELPDEQRVCPVTRLGLVEVGEKTFEELDYQPAQLRVLVHHRKIYGPAPQDAQERQVEPLVAPLPPRPIERSPASAGLLAWMLVQKYRHHLPLYRQQSIFAREGLEIPRQTQCDWVLACAYLLSPIQAALRRRILTSGLLQLDDTPLQCQLAHGAGKRQAHLWVLLSPLVEGVVYDFTLSRGYEEVKALVGDPEGYLVGDGYAVHHKLAGESGGKLVTAGCWSHVLRKYRDAIAESGLEAAAMVVSIGALFAVEREADDGELDSAGRLALRRERCPELLAEIEQRLQQLRGTTSEQGKLADAVGYLQNQWPSLVRFLEDGRIPIHNNSCESAIRPVGVGRRNWLFAGSERGGEAAATAYSLIESCRRAEVDPYAYLRDVLVRVNTHPASQVDDLVPARWKQIFGAASAS